MKEFMMGCFPEFSEVYNFSPFDNSAIVQDDLVK
jgi:hypothetical protein